jgi:integrase/recombinase XerD
MDYSTFKDQFLSLLADGMTVSQIADVLDSVAADYDITQKDDERELLALQEPVSMFIAAKDVEDKSRRTLKLYRSVLSCFIQKIGKPVQKITTADIRDYLSSCKQRGHKNTTVGNTRRILNSFFEWCLLENIVQVNPVRRINSIKQEKSPRHAMQKIELEYLRNACTSLRDKALIDFLYSTGARVSELCNAKIDNIDWERKEVFIDHGKGGVSRLTYLNPEAEVSLKAYLFSRSDESPFIFARTRGHSAAPLDAKTVQNAIDKIVTNSHRQFSVKITPHVFRHTIATVLLRNGMPVEQVQRFLGHANINTTMIYAEVKDDDVRRSHSMYAA